MWSIYETTIEEIEFVIAECYREQDFHQWIKAIDGMYIPIKKPNENPTDFINRKDFYSFNIQAACDNQGAYIMQECF